MSRPGLLFFVLTFFLLTSTAGAQPQTATQEIGTRGAMIESGGWKRVKLAENVGKDQFQRIIALARSLGIPARPVGGIYVGPDGAILHRWAEVYLDRWYEIDSTFGVVEVPATSLRLPSDDGTLLATVPGSRFVFLRGKKGDGSEVLPEPPPASNE